jgi:hypothetical protein
LVLLNRLGLIFGEGRKFLILPARNRCAQALQAGIFNFLVCYTETMGTKETFPTEKPPKPAEEILVKEPAKVEIPRSVETWLQKLETGEDSSPGPVIQDPQTGQVLLSSPQAHTPKITLPITKEEFVVFLRSKVEEAARWLAEWCYRLIKMGPRKVVFKTA